MILSNKIHLKLFFVNIYADAKLLKSLGVGETGTLREKLGCVLYLGECDNVADILKTEKESNQSVKNEGEAAPTNGRWVCSLPYVQHKPYGYG